MKNALFHWMHGCRVRLVSNVRVSMKTRRTSWRMMVASTLSRRLKRNDLGVTTLRTSWLCSYTIVAIRQTTGSSSVIEWHSGMAAPATHNGNVLHMRNASIWCITVLYIYFFRLLSVFFFACRVQQTSTVYFLTKMFLIAHSYWWKVRNKHTPEINWEGTSGRRSSNF